MFDRSNVSRKSRPGRLRRSGVSAVGLLVLLGFAPSAAAQEVMPLLATQAATSHDEGPPVSGSVGRAYVRSWLLEGEAGAEKRRAFVEALRPSGDGEVSPEPSEDPEAQLRFALETLRRSLARQAPSADLVAGADFVAARDQVLAADLLVRARFEAQRDTLEKGELGPVILGRLQAAERDYETRMAPVLEALQSLQGAKASPVSGALEEKLTALLTRVSTELRAETLPSRSLSLAPRAPRTAPMIEAAYERADDVQPVAEDFAAGAEAPLDAPILEKAAALGYDYVRIYEFVRHEIETEPYAGAMKGAVGTLRAGRGNDVDQASLLIALLRASRAAARYVHGVLELSVEEAGRPWGLTEPDAVLAALARAGIAREPVIRGGAVGSVRVEHTWVEAHLPYTNYRGAVVDFTGRTWIPLAPSLVEMEGRDATAILGAMDFEADAFLSGHLAAARDQTPVERLRDEVVAYLAENGGGAYDEQLADRRILPQDLGILPSSLPARVVAVTGEGAELPADLLHRVRLRGYAGPEPTDALVFDQILPLSLAAGSRLTWSYLPATVEDQRTALFFGGLGGVPAYLIEVRPVLKAQGRTLAVGQPMAMARPHLLELEFTGPAGNATVTRQEISGNLSALVIGAPSLWDVSVAEDDLGDTEQLASALLAGLGRTYGGRWDASEGELADLLGVAAVRAMPSLVIVANALSVGELGGLPSSLDWDGVTIDAALRLVEPISQGVLPGAEKSFLRLSSLEGSALEHAVIESEFLVASISADKGLGLAREEGQEILTVDGEDLTPILGALEHPPGVVEALRRWAAPGRRLEIPRRPLTLNAWTGSMWRVEDLQSGAAAYVLTGGLNGGATTEEPGSWLLDFLEDALSGPFASQPNQDPLAGVEIVALPEGDGQEGVVDNRLVNQLTVRVSDEAGRPVEGARVHFVSAAGGGTLIAEVEDPDTGGTFEVESEDELEVRTNALGLATVSLKLGERTSRNAVYPFREPFDEHETQASLHLVDAWIDSHQGVVALPSYLSALAFPDEPDRLVPADGADQIETVLLADTWVAQLYMEVVDQHGNPISNESLRFSMAGEDDGDFGCSSRPHETGAVFDRDLCPETYPSLATCGQPFIDTVTSRFGASAGVISGTGGGIAYLVEVSSGILEPYPRAYVLIEGVYSCTPIGLGRISIGEAVVGPRGEQLTAAGVSEPYIPPITAQFLRWNFGEGDGGFWEPDPPEEVVSEMSGGGSVSPLARVGAADYRGFALVGPEPVVNRITVEGRRNGPSREGFIDIYALEPRVLETFPNPLELSNDDRTVTDLTIYYDVEPADYVALTREALIYEGEQVIAVLPINRLQGPGEIGLGKGAFFDREKRYEIELVVNRGTDVEARSERFRLPIDQQIIARADISLSVSKEVDLPNGLQCEVPDLYNFALNRPATVTLEARRVEGMDTDGGTVLGGPLTLELNRSFPEGDQSIEVFTDDLPPGDYLLTLTATDGEQTEIREGSALSQFTSRDALPVGQSLIKGVNPWNGGLTLNRTDLVVAGRGPSLQFSRTYASNGGKTPNGLGPGWSHSYESKVIATPCGEAIVVGGEGGGMRFVPDAEGNFRPLRGYNGSLMANTEDGSFDFYTIAGTKYRYVLSKPREWLLSEISDPNGNTTRLEYGPGPGGPQLLAVIDSSERRFAFRYESREFALWRGEVLTEVAGPDGLSVVFSYDEVSGNLVRAEREGGALVETYEYTVVPGLDHEVRSVLTKTTNALSGAEHVYTYSSTEIGFEEGMFKGTLVIGVQEPEGGVTLFDYDQDSLAERATSSVTAVIDRVGETSVFSFDRYGSPTSIENPLSHTSTMEWDLTEVQMVSRTDAAGVTTRFEYDDHGNVTEEEVAGYRTTTSYYAPDQFERPYLKNRIRQITDRNGAVTRFSYDARGNLTRESITVELADGGSQQVETVHTYAENGDRLTTRSPRGLVTHFEYDAFGNLVTITDPQGFEMERDYDLRSQLTAERDPLGQETAMRYDTLGRLIERRFADGKSATIEYDDVARTRRETNAEGHTTLTEYDLEGRVIQITNGEGGLKVFEYDAEGRKSLESTWFDASTPRHDIRFEHDAAGRPTRRTEPFGRTTVYEHDEVDNVTKETLRGEGLQPRVTTMRYDALYRPILVTRNLGEDGQVTNTFTYDGLGNRLSETDSLGRTTTFEYDALDRLIRMSEPEGRETRKLYDANGNLVREILSNEPEDQERHLVYDTSGRMVEQIDATGARRSYEYDAAGNLVLETDARGSVTRRGYDVRNRLISRTEITEALGEITTRYRYDGIGNLVGESWPNGNELTHVYDALSRLTHSGDSLGAVTEIEYDARSNRIRQRDANGNDTHQTYDALDRLVRVEAPEDRTLELSYDLAGNLLTATDAEGRRTRLTYDTLDRLLQVMEPAPFSNTTLFEYNSVGRVISRTNRRGHTARFEYDDLDRLIKAIDPEVNGVVTEVTRAYDAVGNVIREVDRRGIETTYLYDAENRRLETRRDGLRLELNTYDANGNVETATDANGHLTTLIYDERNLAVEAKAPLGATAFFTYDAMGDRIRSMDPEGRVAEITYDLRRRPETQTRNAGTETTTYGYDGNGNRVLVRRPEGGEWRYEFDAANRLTAVVNPEQDRTEYAYDVLDNLEKILDGRSRELSFEYDELNRLRRKIYPGGVYEEYDFDANGNLTSLRDAKGQLFAFEYDAKDRQEHRLYPADPSVVDDLESITFEFDPNNNLTRITEQLSQSGAQVTARTYDSFDRLQSVTDRWGHELRYAYDPNGNRTQLIDPDGGLTTYGYDALNRMTTVTVPGAGVTAYSYLKNGLLDEIEYPNGTTSSYTHDGANRLESIENRHGATQVSSFNYGYDLNGNRTFQMESQFGLATETTTYDYDLADRLLSVTYPEKIATYTYDGVGNRATEQEASTVDGTLLKDRTYEYDERDQLTRVLDHLEPSRTAVYGYDANGNQISRQIGSDPVTDFVFDVRDQLVRVENDSLPVGHYKYDFQGLRIEKNVGAGSSRYVYDDQSVLMRYGPESTSKYEYGPDRLLSVNDTSEGRAYYLLDGLGSISNLVSESGAQLAQYRWDAWGNLRHSSDNPANPFGFTGHEMDEESGLIYMKARFYDPETGRFLSHDPLEGDPTSPPSLHRYLYAFQNPTVYTDPTGLMPEDADEEENRGILSGLRDFVKDTFGGEKNKETAEAVEEEFGKGAGGVAGVFLGAASAAGELIDTGLALVETIQEVAVAGLAPNTEAGQRAAERLNDKIDAVEETIQVIAEDPVGVGSALLKGVAETAKGVASGDAGAITEASSALFGLAATLATGGAAGAGAARGAVTTAKSATKAAKAAQAVGKATKAAGRRVQDAVQGATKRLRGSNVTRRLSSKLTRKAKSSAKPNLASKGSKAKKPMCFVAGTLVWTETGLRPIEEIKIGDRVWARDEETGEMSLRLVVTLFVTEQQPILEVELESEDGVVDTIGVTFEHPFNLTGRGWTEASRLEAGDEVQTSRDAILKVRAVRGPPERVTVYNFEVAELHNYFVGETGAWVHNLCDEGKARVLENLSKSRAVRRARLLAKERNSSRGSRSSGGQLERPTRRLNHRGTSGTAIESVPGRATTIIGRFADDLEAIIKELDAPKSVRFDATDDFNVLNFPDSFFVDGDQFFREFNGPWLKAAIDRGDRILFASPPSRANLFRTGPDGKVRLTGFGKEYYLLRKEGFAFDPVSKEAVRIRK